MENEFEILDETIDATGENMKYVFQRALDRVPNRFSSNDIHTELKDVLKQFDKKIEAKWYPAWISGLVRGGKIFKTGEYVPAKFGQRHGTRRIPVYSKTQVSYEGSSSLSEQEVAKELEYIVDDLKDACNNEKDALVLLARELHDRFEIRRK